MIIRIFLPQFIRLKNGKNMIGKNMTTFGLLFNQNRMDKGAKKGEAGKKLA